MVSSGSMKKKRSDSRGGTPLFTFGCGCKDTKSVSVSISVSPSERSTATTTPPRMARNMSSTDTLTLPSASSSSRWEGAEVEYKLESLASTPSFSGLLRELCELEQGVMSWETRTSASHLPHNSSSPPPPPPLHRIIRSDEGGGGRVQGGRLDESIAITKESDDPLGDFRRSMLQMIVEKEIVTAEALRQLLHLFLSLNSQEHHDIILQAFTEIWEQLFADHARKIDPPELTWRKNHQRRLLPPWKY